MPPGRGPQVSVAPLGSTSGSPGAIPLRTPSVPRVYAPGKKRPGAAGPFLLIRRCGVSDSSAATPARGRPHRRAARPAWCAACADQRPIQTDLYAKRNSSMANSDLVHCSHCARDVEYHYDPVNHGKLFLLSVCSLGLWLPIWLFAALSPSKLCNQCGNLVEHRGARDAPAATKTVVSAAAGPPLSGGDRPVLRSQAPRSMPLTRDRRGQTGQSPPAALSCSLFGRVCALAWTRCAPLHTLQANSRGIAGWFGHRAARRRMIEISRSSRRKVPKLQLGNQRVCQEPLNRRSRR